MVLEDEEDVDVCEWIYIMKYKNGPIIFKGIAMRKKGM